MANTTNYNWETPDDTDLVKDGAAAIRTLGNSVDTTTKALNPSTTLGDIEYRSSTSNTNARLGIGSAGQVLTVASGVPSWATPNVGDITAVNVSSPITGGGSSGDVTISIQDGTTAQKGAVQLENSTSSTSTTTAAVPASVKSAYDLANAAIPKSLVDAAGDLIYATANDTVARLAIGTAGQVLKVNSGATAPEWGAASGAASFVGVKCIGNTSTTQSISNSTITAVTWAAESFDTDAFHSTSSNTSRITIPSGKGGKYAINGTIGWSANGTGERILKLYLNGASKEVTAATTTSAGTTTTQINTVYDLVATDYIELYVFQNSGGTRTIQFDDAGEDLCWFSATYLGA